MHGGPCISTASPAANGRLPVAVLRKATPTHIWQAIEDLLRGTDEPPAIRLVNAILLEAVRLGASDVHIQPRTKSVVVRFRIDGVLHDKIQIPHSLHQTLVSRLKIMAELDIAEKRLPQDGRISLRLGSRAVDVRVSTLPSAHGERAVLRLLDKTDSRFTLEGLGMDGDVLQRMPAESLAAAIEIKACPTNIPAQKGLVLEDLFALLALCETHDIQAHFVLLDKAQGLYGRTHDGQHSHLVWDAVHTQTFVIKHKGRKLREFPSFQSAGLVVERGHQAPCDTPFVTCWFLAPGQDGRWHADSRRIRRI